MTHEEKQMALEIAQRFREMENEIRALRVVLTRYWTHQTPAEAFVQKGIQQLQDRQRAEQEPQHLESIVGAVSDGDALLRSLHTEILRRMKIPND